MLAKRFAQILCTITLSGLAGFPAIAQTRSSLGKLPDAAPSRVEVRFAVDKKAVTCDQFSIRVSQGSKSVVDANFTSSFELPGGEPKSPTPPLAVTLGCAGYVWHFDRVPTAMFQRGWWFVGTDYPPFQGDFSCPKFANFRLIRYLQYVRNDGKGFDYYETVPRSSESDGAGCNSK